MQITDFLQTYTGLTNLQLFGGTTHLVALARDGDGTVTVSHWGVTTIAAPSADQIVKALAEPDAPSITVLTAYAAQAQRAVLAKGQTFNVAASGSPVNVLCDGLQSTRADLGLLALYGQANPSGSKTWIDNLGVSTVLSGSQLVSLATLAGDWIADMYPALQILVGQIVAKSVTTTAQIDAYTWPTT